MDEVTPVGVCGWRCLGESACGRAPGAVGRSLHARLVASGQCAQPGGVGAWCVYEGRCVRVRVWQRGMVTPQRLCTGARQEHTGEGVLQCVGGG